MSTKPKAKRGSKTPSRPAADYLTLAVELFTIKDLTDALTVEVAANLLGLTKRAIYTVRNTNVLHPDRISALVSAVKLDEKRCRQRLVVTRNAITVREERKAA